jgi:RNA polymerase sigma-70 factor (ECF subfamily)
VADPSDAELVEAARSGDRAAVEELLRAHQDRIFSLCRRLTGNHADALDATQEAMIAVVRGLPGFDGRSAFSTWVYRVATNACLDELRRRTRRPQVTRLDDIGSRADARAARSRSAPDPGDSVPDRLDIDEALGRLRPEFRAAVVLRDVCRLDYAEIAEVLHIPAGTVRSRIARGRAELAETLAAGNQPPVAERPNEHR